MTNNISNKYSCIILEDKQIYGLNKVHRNVLHAQQNISNVKVNFFNFILFFLIENILHDII